MHIIVSYKLDYILIYVTKHFIMNEDVITNDIVYIVYKTITFNILRCHKRGVLLFTLYGTIASLIMLLMTTIGTMVYQGR